MQRHILFSLLATLVNAATPEETALAQAVKGEAELLHKEVQHLISSKQFDSAIQILNDRGSNWLRLYGAKSWPMAEVSSMLADTFLACGPACDKEDKAVDLYGKSASLKLAIHGEHSPQYAAAIEKLAEALMKIGAHARALPYLKKLATGMAAGLGEEHVGVTDARMRLADCAMRAKSYKTAKNVFVQMLGGKLAAEDEVHARLHLAVAMAHLGESNAALEHIQAAKQLSARSFGNRDLRHAKVLNGAAGVLERLGRDVEAARNMQEASDTVQELLGKEDPMAVQARKNVEGLRRAIKNKRHATPEMVTV